MAMSDDVEAFTNITPPFKEEELIFAAQTRRSEWPSTWPDIVCEIKSLFVQLNAGIL